ncbi:MAG: protein kinase [Proteobacteria bacterium]|nr:protein kinase [Pseudomonadota bacterium]
MAIKMLDKESVIANTQQRLEIKTMRDIRHNNLASFVGACCDSPNVCILMECAPKGSLDDILSMDSLQLDWNFKYSLLKVSQVSMPQLIVLYTQCMHQRGNTVHVYMVVLFMYLTITIIIE